MQRGGMTQARVCERGVVRRTKHGAGGVVGQSEQLPGKVDKVL